MYQYSGSKRAVYLPVISNYLDNGYQIVKVRARVTITNEITAIGFFLFSDRAKSEEFAVLVYDYFLNSVRNCKTGQKFWPEFRVLMAQAENYRSLENIHKSRGYLDSAIIAHEDLKVKKRKEKEQRGEERANDEKMFYPE